MARISVRRALGGRPLLGLAGVTWLAVGCQVLTGISDYETVDGLGGGGAASSTSTGAGPSTGGQGGTGGTIVVVDAPTVVWRYAGVSGAGSFTRGLGIGVGSVPGSPTVVGAVRGGTASLDDFDVSGTRTRSVSFEVVDATTVQNESFGVPSPGAQEAAYSAVSKSGVIGRAGIFKLTIGQTALAVDGPTVTGTQFSLDDDVTPETLASSDTRAMGVHAFGSDDVMVAGNFTGDITVGVGAEGYVGTGLHAIVVRSDTAQANPWHVEIGVTQDTSGDIWVEDFAFEDNRAIMVGRYTGSGNGFQLTTVPGGQTINLASTSDNGSDITDVFYAEVLASGALGEVRGITRLDNQAFTEVERQGDSLFIGGHFTGTLAFSNAPGEAATSDEERGFVARLAAQDLSSPRVVQFAGESARVSAMAANADDLYVTVDCSGSVDVLIANSPVFTTAGGSDDLCFFGFDMATSPPTLTTATRFEGDVIDAEDMIFDAGDVFVTGTYSGQWNLPDQMRVSNDDALFVLRLTPPD